MKAQAYIDKRWQFQWGNPRCISMFDSACHWEADQRHNHSSGLEFFIVFLRLENIFPLNSEVLILMQPLRWFLFFQFFWDIFTLKCPLNTLISRLLHNARLDETLRGAHFHKLCTVMWVTTKILVVKTKQNKHHPPPYFYY